MPDPCQLQIDAFQESAIQVDAAIRRLESTTDALLACRARNPQGLPMPIDINFEMNAIRSNVVVIQRLQKEIARSMSVIQKDGTK